MITDPGGPAVVGYGVPHVFELWPQVTCAGEPVRPWECRWRILWGWQIRIRGYTYHCAHYYRCGNCYVEVPLSSPRLCPWWIDRPCP
jgi:hypothetical protein